MTILEIVLVRRLRASTVARLVDCTRHGRVGTVRSRVDNFGNSKLRQMANGKDRLAAGLINHRVDGHRALAPSADPTRATSTMLRVVEQERNAAARRPAPSDRP